MIFGRSKINEQSSTDRAIADKSYWSVVRQQFYKNRLAIWALRGFYVLFAVALLADFIANPPHIARFRRN